MAFGFRPRRKRDASLANSEKTVMVEPRSSSPLPIRLFSSSVYLLAVVFLILVIIGNINTKAVIRETYFLKIDLSDIIPLSVPNAVFINSIARSIGLHDFYQVGLWNYCAGYDGEGVTYCSTPEALYWFNPVEIITSELLAGATIALPSDLISTLDIVRTASHWMFGLFLSGICVTFLCIFFTPMGFSSQPRWSHKRKRIFCRQLPLTLLTLIALILVAAASVIATVMFIIFRNVVSDAADLNISAALGVPMLAFLWTATGLNLAGFLMQFGTCFGVCCCNGRRKAIKNAHLHPEKTSMTTAAQK